MSHDLAILGVDAKGQFGIRYKREDFGTQAVVGAGEVPRCFTEKDLES